MRKVPSNVFTRTAQGVFVLVVALLAPAMGQGTATAIPTPTPPYAAAEVSVPGNAASNPNGFLGAISCPGSESTCVSVGAYTDNANLPEPMSIGAGGTTETQRPTGATGGAALLGVSCPTTMFCVAVGTDQPTAKVFHAFAEFSTGGAFGQGVEVTPPSNASATNPNAELNAVSCDPTATTCLAVGFYEDTSGKFDAMAAYEGGGAFSQAVEVTLPSNVSPTQPNAYLNAVSCTTATFCEAVGGYDNNDSTAHSVAIAVTASSGTFAAPTVLALPANALNGQPSGVTSMNGIKCFDAMTCVVVGDYVDNNDLVQGMSASELSGTFAAASEVTLPANADTYIPSQLAQVSQLFGIDCMSTSSCLASGFYVDSNGDEQAMVVQGSTVGFAAGTEVTLPPNQQGQPNALLGAVACTTDSCAAVGIYTDNAGNNQAMVAVPAANVPPMITSVSPSSGTTAGGTVVTITGQNFFYPASVSFGNAATQDVAVISPTEIEATSPPGTAGVVTVTVTTDNQTVTTPSPVFTYVTPPPQPGYDLVGSDGGVFVFGASGHGYFGSLPGLGISVNNIKGIVASSDDNGYFLVGSDGGVFSFGDTSYEGSLPGLQVRVHNIVGIVPTSDDRGYFLVGSDGGVFSFGDSSYEGSLPGIGVRVNNIIGIAATPDAKGYWLVGADGSVYAFGDAPGLGGAPGTSSPVSGIASTPSGHGYWIVTQNGGVYPFGDAASYGSLPALGVTPAAPVVALVPTRNDQGYWLIGSDGGVFSFGNAPNVGSLPGLGVSVSNIVGAVPTFG
jgi:hypothetical protein